MLLAGCRLKKIEADAPAEKAAEAAEAAKGSPAKSPKGAGESLDDAADKMKAMQDKITADLVGAGIEVRPRLCLTHAFRGSWFDSVAVRVCPQSVIKNTPAASIAPTALKTGWLRKEGKGNKAFKRRFFVLWSTPDAVARMVRTNHVAQAANSRQAAVLKDVCRLCRGSSRARVRRRTR